MDPVNIRISGPSVPQPGLPFAPQVFIDYVEERTEGKVTFEPYWGGSLHPYTESLTSLEGGVTDMTVLSTTHYPSDLPLSNWFAGVGSMQDPSLVLGTIQGALATNESFLESPELEGEFTDHGIKALGVWNTPPYDLHCRRPVFDAESAQGARTRVGGEVWTKEIEALGMAPTFMNPLELYEAFQRGAIECTAQSLNQVVSQSLWEVASDYTPAYLSPFVGAFWGIRLELWESFPDELKEIFERGTVEYSIATLQGTFDPYFRYATEGVEEHGVVFHDPTEIDAIVSAWQAEALAALPANAPSEFSDPQGTIDHHGDRLAYWRDALIGIGVDEVPRDPEAILQSYASLDNVEEAIDWDAIRGLVYERLGIDPE